MKHHILSSLVFFVLLSINLNATVINVPADFETIQEAIDTAQAGDTVFVHPGTYFETPFLKADIFLLGSGYDTTFIDGEEKGDSIKGNVITVIGSGSTIEGFTIENANLESIGNSGVGIDGNGFSFIARKNRIRNCRIGIRVIGEESGSSLVERNVIYDNPGLCGILVFEPPSTSPISPKIINNTIYNSSRGIQFSNSQPEIINNIVMDNFYGIASFDTIVSVIKFNDLYSNVINYPFIPDQTGINGNISADPLFVSIPLRDFNLTIDSPCIDAGDSLTVKDPDSTRADIGALYFPQPIMSISGNLEAFKNLSVYPNPTSDILYIDKGENQELKILVFDNVGKALISKTSNDKITELDFRKFSPGIYYINISDGEHTAVQKIVKH